MFIVPARSAKVQLAIVANAHRGTGGCVLWCFLSSRPPSPSAMAIQRRVSLIRLDWARTKAITAGAALRPNSIHRELPWSFHRKQWPTSTRRVKGMICVRHHKRIAIPFTSTSVQVGGCSIVLVKAKQFQMYLSEYGVCVVFK